MASSYDQSDFQFLSSSKERELFDDVRSYQADVSSKSEFIPSNKTGLFFFNGMVLDIKRSMFIPPHPFFDAYDHKASRSESEVKRKYLGEADEDWFDYHNDGCCHQCGSYLNALVGYEFGQCRSCLVPPQRNAEFVSG